MPELPALLHGRRGLIIGVSRENSVGYHCARTFRRLGAQVAISYRPSRSAHGSALAARLGCSLHVSLDWNDEPSVTAAFQRIESDWERLDFLIHTTVHTPPRTLNRPLTELSSQAFSSALSTGAYSLIAAARHGAPLLKRSSSPRLVTLTSAGDSFVIPGYHVLGITKAALNAGVRYLAHELGQHGILCNGLSFSLVDTAGATQAIGADAVGRARAHLARTAPTHAALDMEQVTLMTALLASAYLRNVTGQIITQDGGYSQVYFKGDAGLLSQLRRGHAGNP
ncbi:enoyl-ACP reductase [Streptomyces lavendulae]|uniref:enoyl-ACP reductase FabI n=2 Tax=Streptomyces lavendulae TaxID=1914 RepID=UPI00367DD4E9